MELRDKPGYVSSLCSWKMFGPVRKNPESPFESIFNFLTRVLEGEDTSPTICSFTMGDLRQ
jgi:hypothetical protein